MLTLAPPYGKARRARAAGLTAFIFAALFVAYQRRITFTDSGGCNDIVPALGLVAEKCGRLRRRASHRRCVEIAKPLCHIGQCQCF